METRDTDGCAASLLVPLADGSLLEASQAQSRILLPGMRTTNSASFESSMLQLGLPPGASLQGASALGAALCASGIARNASDYSVDVEFEFAGGDEMLRRTSRSLNQSLDSDDFDLSRSAELGRGASGAVRAAIRKSDGEPIAIKTMKEETDELQRELKLIELRSTHVGDPDDAHLVRVDGAYVGAGQSVSLVMERMAGSLSSLHKLPEDIAVGVIFMALQGLRYMHDTLRVIHRDIKLGNLLYDMSGRVKVADFGLAVPLKSHVNKAKTFVGSLTHMAPERLRGDSYSFASDVFSIGVVLVQLLLGEHPLARDLVELNSNEEKFWKLAEKLGVTAKGDASTDDVMAVYTSKLVGAVTPECLDLLRGLLHANDQERLTAQQALKHPFFVRHGLRGRSFEDETDIAAEKFNEWRLAGGDDDW